MQKVRDRREPRNEVSGLRDLSLSHPRKLPLSRVICLLISLLPTSPQAPQAKSLGHCLYQARRLVRPPPQEAKIIHKTGHLQLIQITAAPPLLHRRNSWFLFLGRRTSRICFFLHSGKHCAFMTARHKGVWRSNSFGLPHGGFCTVQASAGPRPRGAEGARGTCSTVVEEAPFITRHPCIRFSLQAAHGSCLCIFVSWQARRRHTIPTISQFPKGNSPSKTREDHRW